MTKRLAVLIVLLVVLIGCTASGLATRPTSVKSLPVTFNAITRLEFADGICSGTVVAKNTILSAKHCFEHDPQEVQVNGQKAKILSIISDDDDHTLAVVDITFSKFAVIGPRPEVGEPIYYWGNAARFNNLLRKGYVSGFIKGDMALDVNGWFGDSGAGIFDSNGKLIGVVNFLFGDLPHGFRLLGVSPLTFTPQQLQQAGL